MKSKKIFLLEFILLCILAFFLVPITKAEGVEGGEEDDSEYMQFQIEPETPPPLGSDDSINEEYTTQQSLKTFHQVITDAPYMDDSREYNEDFGWTHTFDTTDKVIILAELVVSAYDVDWIIGEINTISTDGIPKGMLLGGNKKWSQTTFIIPAWELMDNKLDVWVNIDATHWKFCWWWWDLWKWKWVKSCIESPDFEIEIGWSELIVTYWDLSTPPPATPVANLGGPYTNIEEGTPFTLDASASTNGEDYRWDFNGDGTWDTGLSTSPKRTFVYIDEGTYTVNVEVGNEGETDIATASVSVINVAPGLSPMPDLTKFVGQEIDLFGHYYDPGIYDSLTATWDFGDGAFAAGIVDPQEINGKLTGAGIVNGSHIYTDSGIYTVTLTLDDGDGGVTSTTMIVTVYPKANAGGPYMGYEGSPVLFDASGSLGAAEYRWDFDTDGIWDKEWSTDPTATYTWDDDWAGTATVEVRKGTLTDTSTTSVDILNVAPTLTISGLPEVDEGSVYTLTLDSIDPGDDTITSWEVNWGDETIELFTGSALTVTHIYADGPNSYLISATATDEDGTYSAITEEGGFEIGDFTGWTQTIPAGGTAQVVGSHTGDSGTPYTPVQGNYFARLKTDGPGSYTSIQTTVFLYAGQTISGWAAFDSWDYVPYNDNAAVRILNSPTSVIATPWYSDVGIVGDYGDGLWTEWDWTALTDGNYIIEYRIANALDSILDSYALFDMDFSVITVNNVAPTLTISGLSEVDEGSSYTLSLSSSDPGDDIIEYWDINWGDGPVQHVLGNPSSVDHTFADGPNSYIISATATDEDGTFSAAPLTVTVNNVAPIPTILGPSEVDEDFEFSFSGDFYDPGADTLDKIWWEFTEGAGFIQLDTLNPLYTYVNPGVYLVRLKVEDDDGGVGVTGHFTITVLDKTPPETTLTLGCHYIDEFGTTYVTSSTPFTLEVTDEFSDIAYTKYIINGEIYDYTGPFTLSGPDGIYIVSFYSEDTAGNKETPPETHPLEFCLVNLKESSWLTDSDFNPITYFDFIFRKNKPEGVTLVATNPGQFYYHIEVVNTWPIPIDTLTITAVLPDDFILKGAMPIHVYLDGADITESCTIDGAIVEVLNVPSGSMVYVTVHMDYGLKGSPYLSIDGFIIRSYQFDAIASGEGILTGTYDSSSILIGHQKKSTGICGFVTDTDGNPRVDVTVNLYTEDGVFLRDTTTDENGFYYFIDLELPAYQILIDPITDPIIIMDITVKKDDFIEANLSY